jgi:hypothetical protein
MPQNPVTPPAILHSDSEIPAQPVSVRANEFTERVQGLLDGQPKDDATVTQAFTGLDEMFDLIAAGMYSMASMLVGEGEDSIRLVETAVANVDVAAAHGSAEARKASRRALCAAAIDTIVERDPASLAAPKGLEHAATCIEDDDLDAAGDAHDQLERMIAGPDRDRVRNWLESLGTVQRTIFVLRAIAGFTPGETADLLRAHGGPDASGWNPDAVRELFRQALCSLASHLLQEANR